MADVVNRYDGFETKRERQHVARNERHVGLLTPKGLPQSPVRPQPRERDAAPLDA